MVNKGEKFLFNQHIFDEPGAEEDIPEAPPAPSFSEEELETVRRATQERAYNAGKQDGINSEKASRDERIASLIEKISHDVALLFAAEDERERVFEAESLRLTLEIFSKLFPHYKQQHGFNELAAAVTDVLAKQHGQSKIVIEVHPDNVEGVLSHIAALSRQGHDPQKYDIKAAAALDADAFTMRWQDGGAICNRARIADEIVAILQDGLAGSPTNSHDSMQHMETDMAAPRLSADHTIPPSATGAMRTDQDDNAIDDDIIMEKPDE